MTLIEELQRRVDLKKQLVILLEEEIAELELKIEQEREKIKGASSAPSSATLPSLFVF